MRPFSSILSSPSSSTSNLNPVPAPARASRAGAFSLCLAAAAAATVAAGCVDEGSPLDAEPATTAVTSAVTSQIYPDHMWANSVWIEGGRGSSGAYSQVRFQFTNSAGVHDFTLPIYQGGFSRYQPGGSPYNGDVVRITWSGPGLDDVGCSMVFRYTGGAVYSFTEMGCVATPRLGNVVLNEILANEGGNRTSEEFIELVNLGDGNANLGGWTLSDSLEVRHTFPAGTTLSPGRAIAVYAGAAGAPPRDCVVLASSGSLALNNTGDLVTLRDATGQIRYEVNYGAALASADGVSMNLTPEGTASGTYVLHTALTTGSSSSCARTTGQLWW